MNNRIILENVPYRIHPTYNKYAASEEGYIIHVDHQIPTTGSSCGNGYCNVSVRSKNGKPKSYISHRFIWECYNGLISDNKVIDHINDIKADNRLVNLQLVTQQENCQKSAKKRDYTFAKNNHKNKKCVKATNIQTNEISFFNSMYAIQQHLGINAGLVKMVCEGLHNAKSGKSKINGDFYKFQYINKTELPENYIKSGNIRPRRVTDEEKRIKQRECIKRWVCKLYICPRCNKHLKNGSRHMHNKICN